jgi:hypothetical protein
MAFTTEQLRTAFTEATKERFAHFNKLDWLPEWKDGEPKPLLQSTVLDKDPPNFSKPTMLRYDEFIEDRMENLRTRYKNQLDHISRKKREAEDPKTPEQPAPGKDLEKVPDPWSDVSHIDPGIFQNDEPDKLKGAPKLIEDLLVFGMKDGETGTALRTALHSLEKINHMLEKKSMGMQRLKLIFEWTLCHVTALFGEINTALADCNRIAYTDARNEYIKLLQDLDDGEPETKEGDPPKSARKGYGRVIKWVYFFPLIHTPDSKTEPARIKGVIVVAKWNPHVSSSGVPIAH